VSVVANVAINVDSRNAVGKLRQVQSQSQATERAVGNLGAAVSKLAAALGVVQAARFVFVKTAELESQARSLQVLTGSAEKANQIIKDLQQLGAVTPFTSSELIDSAKRLQAFGVETEKVVETTRRLADVSGATGAELQGLVTAFGQVQAKGRLQGEELLQFQERGVALQQELRKQYNLSGEEFQDALQKGKISAEAVEFAIQKLTDTGGKYANGAIAQSDTLNGRLSTLQDGIEALARRIGQVLTPALKAIFNQAIAVVDAINAAIAAGRGGGFTRNVAGARQFLNIGATSQAIQNIEKGIGQVNPQKNKAGIEQNLQALQQYQRLLQSIGPNDPNASRAVQLQGVILQKINQNIEAQKQLQAGAQQTQKLFTPPPLGDGTTKGGKDKNKERQSQIPALQNELALQSRILEIVTDTGIARLAGNKATEAALQIEQILEERSAKIADINLEKIPNAEKELKIKIATAEADRQLVEASFARQNAAQDLRVEQQKQIAEILSGLDMELIKSRATSDVQRQAVQFLEIENQLKAQGITLTDQDAEAIRLKIAEIQKLKKEQEAVNAMLEMEQQLYDGIAGAVANTFGGAIDAAVKGTENLGDSLKNLGLDLLQTISKMLIMYSIAQALGALGGNDGVGVFSALAKAFGFNGRANGGPVTGGTPYIVGERGPELFVPGRSGSIVPNHQLGGGENVSVVVNVDAKGTSVQGNDQQGNQLGRAISAAVQAELIKQKRPGGLLAV
jgi:tape measure domain-containing protein